ncbi:hypothetical protein KY289_037452 [Solanum tuberosum]|nr:hypothetical protein KY289_037452 [Solanum tuberosum]
MFLTLPTTATSNFTAKQEQRTVSATKRQFQRQFQQFFRQNTRSNEAQRVYATKFCSFPLTSLSTGTALRSSSR